MPQQGPDPAGRPINIRVGDVATSGHLYRFQIDDASSTRWLATSRAWRPVSSDSAPARFSTIDILIVSPPNNAQGNLLYEGEIVQVQWCDEPHLETSRLFALSPAPAALRSPAGQSQLFQSLAPALQDPTERWRVRLLADRLRASGFEILADRLDQISLGSEALETVATTLELQWRRGLDRLVAADPVMAREVAEALTRIATVNGLVRPTWTPAVVTGLAGGVDRLFSDLLDEKLSIATLLARVDAWLDTQPRAVAWVMDDAGAADPNGGLALSRAGVVDLAGRGGMAQAEFNEDRPGPGVMVTPLGGASIVASESMAMSAIPMRISLGDWSVERQVVAGALGAQPPGMPLSPFLQPWTLSTWLVGSPIPAPRDEATAALLVRRVDGAWEIRLECRTPTSELPAGDMVRLWFGSSRQPRAILRIDPRGFIIDELEPVGEDESPTRTPVVIQRGDDRWSCIIDLPPEMIEAGSMVRLGLERRQADGTRSLWPRPVLPEQDQPGRALIRLDHWFGSQFRQVR